MGFYSWGNLIEEESAALTDYTRELSRQVTRGACRLWNRYPNNVFAINPVTRGVMRSVCTNLDQPPPDPGSRPNGVYSVTFYYTLAPTVPGGGEGDFVERLRTCDDSPWRGTVESTRILISPPPGGTIPGRWTVYLTGIKEGETTSREHLMGTNNYGPFADLDEGTMRVEVEDCDPVPVVLPEPLVEPVSVTIINNNTENVEYGDVYDVTYETNNNTLELGVNVNVGGIQIVLDVGGVYIGGGNGSPPPGAPGDGNGDNGDSVESPRPTINIDNFNNVFVNPDGEPVGTEEEQPEAEEIEEEIDKFTQFLIVTVSTEPRGGRTQIYRDSEDTDFFAGYVAFNVGARSQIWQELPIPLRKKRNLIKAPSYATGYRVYAVNGAKLKVSRLEIKEE